MATNKTDFLGLNDWIGTDPFKRDEFNANFRALEAKAKEHEDTIGSLSKDANEYEWTSAAGQLTYVLPAGQSYNTTSKWFEVTVGGAPVPLSQIQMDSSTQFTLLVDSAAIPAGVTVVARWTEPSVPATAGHHTKHELGGADEIDITKLKNFNEQVASPLADKAPKKHVYMSSYAKGDGTDETLSVQAALDAAVGKTLIWEKQTGSKYATKKIYIRSNTTIIFENGTILEAAAGHSGALVFLDQVQNVVMNGNFATVQMIKANYATEFNHGFGIRGSSNIIVENFNIKDTGGDGISVYGLNIDTSYYPNDNVTISNCIIDNVKRNGIAVTHGTKVVIKDCTLKNTNGTAPAAGLDIESTTADYLVENIKVFRNRIYGNVGAGIYCSGAKKVKIYENYLYDNAGGGIYCLNNFIGANINITAVDSTTDTITAPNHGLVVGDLVQFSIGTGGVLPSGLSASVKYYVSSVPSVDTFTVSSYKYFPTTPIDLTTVGTLPFYVAKKDLSATEKIRIYENHIKNCYTNIYAIYCRHISVHDNATESGDTGITFSYIESSSINDNKVYNAGNKGIDANGFSNSIFNNEVYASVKAGLSVTGCSKNRIENNKLIECADAGTETTNAAAFISNTKESKISGNYIRKKSGSSNPLYGLKVGASTASADNNFIMGNDCYLSGQTNGLVLSSTTDVNGGNRNNNGTFSTTAN